MTTVAVIGATGLVGEMTIQLLQERDFPLTTLHALASERSLGRSVSFRGRSQPVRELNGFDFSTTDLALFCAGAAVAREYVPQAAAAGCLVIDDSPVFRCEEDVPLVVPEVNPHAIAGFSQRRILATPGAATIQLVVALKPLQDAAAIERIDVASYQAVSGMGRAGLQDLAEQSIQLLSGRGPIATRDHTGQIAFNCIPQVDEFEDNGYTREEMQLIRETHTILEDPTIRISATAVGVPVFYGHSQVVHLQMRRPMSAAQARELLANAPGVEVLDERRPGGYPTAATEAANRDTVYVGRIREDLASGSGLNLWVVADNVRKGAATNSIQIAEILVRQHM